MTPILHILLMWAVVWFGFRALRVLAMVAGPAAVVLSAMSWGLVWLAVSATVNVVWP
jgi:hypothetical protein